MNREAIILKARELAALISESAEVKVFKQAEEKIKENSTLQSLISDLRRKQKELVSYEHLKKEEIVSIIEGEMEGIQEQIDDIPIVQEFKQTQVEINHLLQTITGIITEEVTKHITGKSRDEEWNSLQPSGQACSFRPEAFEANEDIKN